MKLRHILFMLLIGGLSISCNNDESGNQSFDLNVRISKDPGMINPFYAPTSVGREVYQYVFLPLADFHPESLELSPILLERVPEAKDTMLDDQKYVVYDMDLIEDAKWSDGASLSAKDYLFTVQAIKHPNSEISAWKPYFEALKKIELDGSDESKFKVYFDPDYMLSKEVAVTCYILPSHIFDPEGYLLGKGQEPITEGYTTEDTTEISLINALNASVTQKEDIVQLGPYRIQEYQNDEYLILNRKEDYWGSAYPENVFLQQGPQNIIMRVVPDEVSALNMAKEGRLDFISFKNSNYFFELKNNEEYASKWSFHNPQIMQYYYFTLNNTSPVLSDKRVRQAMSYLLDVPDYIENIENGLGTQTIGHFNPSKPYYNNDIQARPFDVDKAKELLVQSGWEDSDGDGILDKLVEGKRTSLKLELLITGSELSQKIALLFQEAASKAGIEIDIVTKKGSLMRKENIGVYNYDMAATAAVSDAAPDDPYSRFHSDNAKPGTRNESGFSNAEADRLINAIRTTRSDEERKSLYMEFQELMYDEMPILYLYSPMQKIVISNRIEGTTSSKRPGYMANTFKLAD